MRAKDEPKPSRIIRPSVKIPDGLLQRVDAQIRMTIMTGDERRPSNPFIDVKGETRLRRPSDFTLIKRQAEEAAEMAQQALEISGYRAPPLSAIKQDGTRNAACKSRRVSFALSTSPSLEQLGIKRAQERRPSLLKQPRSYGWVFARVDAAIEIARESMIAIKELSKLRIFGSAQDPGPAMIAISQPADNIKSTDEAAMISPPDSPAKPVQQLVPERALPVAKQPVLAQRLTTKMSYEKPTPLYFYLASLGFSFPIPSMPFIPVTTKAVTVDPSADRYVPKDGEEDPFKDCKDDDSFAEHHLPQNKTAPSKTNATNAPQRLLRLPKAKFTQEEKDSLDRLIADATLAIGLNLDDHVDPALFTRLQPSRRR